MRDDHAGGARIDLLRRLPRKTLPILRLQVLAVNAVDHPSPDVADLEEFRHAEHEFLRGDGGMDGAGAIVDIRRNRPAGAEHRHRGLVSGRRWETRFRSGGRLFRNHLNGLDVTDGDSNIVPVWEFQREDVLAAEPVVRHEGALVRFAFRMNDDRVSLTGIRAVQDGPDPGRVVHRPRNRSARYGLCAASLMTVARDGGRWAPLPERVWTEC